MIISKADQLTLATQFRDRLFGPVSIEVWSRKESALVRSDRDPCTHCDDAVTVARELASLHPGISFTAYDLDRHADRAAEAGIDRPPVTVFRAHGRAVRFVGYFSGALFPSIIDTILLAGAGTTPLSDESRQTLQSLPEPVELEVLCAPYDPLSAHMVRLVFALGIESARISATAWEMSEFPMLAGQRQLTEVPVTVINGQRYAGAWIEDDLVEQIRRIVSADDTPVIRDQTPSSPFLTVDQAREMAELQVAQQAASGVAPQQPATPGGSSPGGLFIPGRD